PVSLYQAGDSDAQRGRRTSKTGEKGSDFALKVHRADGWSGAHAVLRTPPFTGSSEEKLGPAHGDSYPPSVTHCSASLLGAAMRQRSEAFCGPQLHGAVPGQHFRGRSLLELGRRV